MCTCSGDPVTAAFVPVDENVGQVIVQTELQETVTGTGDGPTVFIVVFHQKAMGLCAVTESPVVVCPASGTVLDAIYVIVVVHHFVQQCGGDLFDGTGQGSGTNIDFVESSPLRNPGVIPEGEMAVGLRCALDGNRRS